METDWQEVRTFLSPPLSLLAIPNRVLMCVCAYIDSPGCPAPTARASAPPGDGTCLRHERGVTLVGDRSGTLGHGGVSAGCGVLSRAGLCLVVQWCRAATIHELSRSQLFDSRRAPRQTATIRRPRCRIARGEESAYVDAWWPGVVASTVSLSFLEGYGCTVADGDCARKR